MTLLWLKLAVYSLYLISIGIYILKIERLVGDHKELIELNRSKDNFMTLISHELRTPLTSIKGFCEMLIKEEAGKLTLLQRDFLTTIFKSAKKLETRINSIIELAGLNNKAINLKKENVVWLDLINDVYKEFNRNIEYKKIRSEIYVDKNIGEIYVDRKKIKKALSNLLLNAIKFTEPGGKIEIRAVRKGDLIETSVIDTGLGVSREMKKKIFEKFVQTQKPITRDNDGLGLGLALTKRIIECHKGKIVINSLPGKGSEFKIILKG